MSNNATTAPIYNATFSVRLDDKRRIQVPAMWRSEEEGFQFTLIVWRKHQEGACLRALPPKEMQELMATLDAMPNENKNKTVLKRIIGSGSCQVQADKAGRLCLPDEMVREAGLKSDVTLVGLLDRFEIWDSARYAKVKAADSAHEHEALNLME